MDLKYALSWTFFFSSDKMKFQGKTDEDELYSSWTGNWVTTILNNSSEGWNKGVKKMCQYR